MDAIWRDLYQAARDAIHPRVLSRFAEAGGVAAAVESASGKIYVGSVSTPPVRWGYARNAMPSFT